MAIKKGKLYAKVVSLSIRLGNESIVSLCKKNEFSLTNKICLGRQGCFCSDWPFFLKIWLKMSTGIKKRCKSDHAGSKICRLFEKLLKRRW